MEFLPFNIKILGRPIGGMAEFDGDNDGKITGPTGEDIVPYFKPDAPEAPGTSSRFPRSALPGNAGQVGAPDSSASSAEGEVVEGADEEIDTSPEGLLVDPTFDVGETLADAIYAMFGERVEQEATRLADTEDETELGKIIRTHARTLQRYMRRGIDPRTEEGARRALLELAPQLADADTAFDLSVLGTGLPGATGLFQVYPSLPQGNTKQDVADIGRVLHLLSALNGDLDGHSGGFLREYLGVLTLHSVGNALGLGGSHLVGLFATPPSMPSTPQMFGTRGVLSFIGNFAQRARREAQNPGKSWGKRAHDDRLTQFMFGGVPATPGNLAAVGLTPKEYNNLASRVSIAADMVLEEMRRRNWPKELRQYMSGVGIADHELTHPVNEGVAYMENLGVPLTPVDLTTPEGQDAMYNAIFMHFRAREFVRASLTGQPVPSDQEIRDRWNRSVIRDEIQNDRSLSIDAWKKRKGMDDQTFEVIMRRNFGDAYVDSVGAANIPVEVATMYNARNILANLYIKDVLEDDSDVLYNPSTPTAPTHLWNAVKDTAWGPNATNSVRMPYLDEYTDADYAALFERMPELSPDGKSNSYYAGSVLSTMYGWSKAAEFSAEGLSLSRLMPELQSMPKSVNNGVLPANLKMLIPKLREWIDRKLREEPKRAEFDRKLKVKQLFEKLFIKRKQASMTDGNWESLSSAVQTPYKSWSERFYLTPAGTFVPYFPVSGCSGYRSSDWSSPEILEAFENADWDALEAQYAKEFDKYYGLSELNERMAIEKKAREQYAQDAFKHHLDGVATKILGAPIGGMAEFDGDNDGFVTGPTGEDVVPFTQKPIIAKPSTSAANTEKAWLSLLPEFTKNSWFGRLFRNDRSADAPVLEAVNEIIESHARLRQRYEKQYGDMSVWANAERAIRDMFPNLGVATTFESEVLKRAFPDRRMPELAGLYTDPATGDSSPSSVMIGLVLSILQEGENMSPQHREMLTSIWHIDDPNDDAQGSYESGLQLHGDSIGIAGQLSFMPRIEESVDGVVDYHSRTTKRQDMTVEDIASNPANQYLVAEQIAGTMARAGYSDDAIKYVLSTVLAGHEFGHVRHFARIYDEIGLGERIKVEEPGSIQKMEESLMKLATARREFSMKAFGFDPWTQQGRHDLDSALPLEMFELLIEQEKNDWQARIQQGTADAREALRSFGYPVLDRYSPDNIPDEWFAAVAYGKLINFYLYKDPRPQADRPAGDGDARRTGHWAWYHRANGVVLDGSLVDAMLGAPDSRIGGRTVTMAQDDLTDGEYRALMDTELPILGRGGSSYLLSSAYGASDFSEFVPEMALLRRFRLLDDDALSKALREAVIASEKIWDWLGLAQLDRDIKTKQDGSGMAEQEGLVFSPPVTTYDIVDGRIYGSSRKVCSGHARPSMRKADAEKLIGDTVAMQEDTSQAIRRMDAALRLRKIREMNGEKSVESERLVHSANHAVRDYYYVHSNAMKVKEASPYTNPALRERIKNRIMAGSQGGRPGQWSARKAQLLAARYRAAGGGYKKGKRPTKAQRSLKKWTREKWRTSDRKPALRNGRMRRYLPDKVWGRLSRAQRDATNRKKIQGDKRGQQFVPNTRVAAKKSRTVRKSTGK